MNINSLLRLCVLCALAVDFIPTRSLAADLSKADVSFFDTKIRPIFAEKCYQCHSHQSEKLRGGLMLDSREGVLKGGNTGPAVVPGNLDKSLLIQAVRYTNEDLQMPPKGEKLTSEQVSDLEKWVKMGAPDPRTSIASASSNNRAKSGREHWAFQPVKRPVVPVVSQTNWVANPVDAFVLAKLEEGGMKPSPAADKRTLIRRATFDLTGLPPTPAEVQAFLDDNSPEAFAKVVDRLLDSKQYGVRWGRYWLDTARYSDTKGEVKKKKEDPHYPFAWTYRDYVVDAFNSDKPYNRFIMEQIAADKIRTSNDRSSLAALGFLTIGDRFDNKINDIINDQIDVVTKGFLGLTVSCARCHDHKFDPIPTKDYYSLHGIFSSCREPATLPVLGVSTNSADYYAYLKRNSELEKELTALQEKRRSIGKDPKARKQLQNQVAQVNSQLARLDLDHPGAPVRAMVLEDKLKPADSHVFVRGEAENKGELVPRRYLEVLSAPRRQPFKIGSGRMELAYAIASTNSPLTARVMVNRIWLHHFGEGIVTTPDDFGTQSAPPSHPELLDYLASRFMESGWSIKAMHRLMMLSSTYEQSSDNNPRYAQIDPNNRLLWRANIRRLEFEALRDSLLAIGGKLDVTIGGRPVDLTSEPYPTRRTIYGYIDRSDLPELLNHFDFANPDLTTGKRYQTTVPQQTLFLMNSPLVVEQAKALVTRPDFRATTDDVERVELLYSVVYQRPPKSEEVELGLEFLDAPQSTERVVSFSPAGAVAPRRARQQKGGLAALRKARAGEFRPRPPLSRWEEYAHALLQANEASYVN